MAVPFSDNTLRVPQGFANLLEGLSREVLRQQPEDIPNFAAQYFAELLQKREESGADPAKWGALMEQRLSKDDTSSDAVNQETCSPVKETTSSVNEDTISQQDPYENVEDDITQATQISPPPDTLDSFNNIEEAPEPQQNHELNESDEESLETDFELLYRENTEVDVCAEELKNTVTAEEHLLENIHESARVYEADPVALTSYHGLADIDVCAEELQSISQEEEHTEGSGDVTVTDAGYIPPSESPVLFEQGVLHTPDEFAQSETEASFNVNQEITDVCFNESTIAFPVNEEKPEANSDLSANVSEMTNTLLDDAGLGIHYVDQLHLNEEAESTSVEGAKTFDETYTDEMPIETMSESSFILENVSLEGRNHNSRSEAEDWVNAGSEIQMEYNYGSVTDVTIVADEKDSQIDLHEDKPYDDKQHDPKDIPDMNPVHGVESFVDTNLNPTGILAEDIKKDDTRTSQHVDEVKDISEVDEGNNSMNTHGIMEDTLFYSTFTHDSRNTLSTFDEPDQDIKVNCNQSATPIQEHSEEPEPAADIEDSEQLEDQVHKPIPESENKDADQQEASSQPQEEEDIMDIPLDDPEANKAAAKIQAGFRGHMTRKKLKPGDKPGEEVSSTGETLNGSQGDAAGRSEGVETEDTSVPEQ